MRLIFTLDRVQERSSAPLFLAGWLTTFQHSVGSLLIGFCPIFMLLKSSITATGRGRSLRVVMKRFRTSRSTRYVLYMKFAYFILCTLVPLCVTIVQLCPVTHAFVGNHPFCEFGNGKNQLLTSAHRPSTDCHLSSLGTRQGLAG